MILITSGILWAACFRRVLDVDDIHDYVGWTCLAVQAVSSAIIAYCLMLMIFPR